MEDGTNYEMINVGPEDQEGIEENLEVPVEDPKEMGETSEMTENQSEAVENKEVKKRMRSISIFKPEYKRMFRWAQPSLKGETFVHCSACDKDIRLTSMGRSALLSHQQTNKHKRASGKKGALKASETRKLKKRVKKLADLFPDGIEGCTENVGGLFAS